MRDTYHNTKTVQALVPAVKTATGNGDPIDLQGFRSALIVVNTGSVGGDGDFTVIVQESDTTTSGDFENAAAADLHGEFPETLAANTVYRVGYVGSKRYIRARLVRDSGTNIALGAVAVLQHPALAPVA